MNENLIIIGAGGHGKVCLDIALETNRWEDIYFLDDYCQEKEILGHKVLGTTDLIDKYKEDTDFLVGIGNNEIRSKILNNLVEKNYNITTLIHPKAIISRFVTIGEGTVVMPGAIINSNTEIGIGNIVNTNAIVEHDCKIGKYNHISPSSVLLGSVILMDCNWIGSNSVIKEKVKIDSYNIIGSNSFINSDWTNHKIILGIPGVEK